MQSKSRYNNLNMKQLKGINMKQLKGIKVNKGNFTATLIRFNQNLNYEKIYVFRMQI